MLGRKHGASDPEAMCALLESEPAVAHHENAREALRNAVQPRRIHPLGTDREVLEIMNNSSSVASVKSVSSKKSLVLGRARGAAMVEYALLLVAVLLVADGAYKALGHKLSKSVKSTHSVLY